MYSNFSSFIIYSIALYIIMKAARIVMGYFTQQSKSKPEVNQQRTPHKVDKKDIVEAEFEDITDKDKD